MELPAPRRAVGPAAPQRGAAAGQAASLLGGAARLSSPALLVCVARRAKRRPSAYAARWNDRHFAPKTMSNRAQTLCDPLKPAKNHR